MCFVSARCVFESMDAGWKVSFLCSTPWHSRFEPLWRRKSCVELRCAFWCSICCAVSTSFPTCSVIEPSDHRASRAFDWRGVPSPPSRHRITLSVRMRRSPSSVSSSSSSNVSGSNGRGWKERMLGRRTRKSCLPSCGRGICGSSKRSGGADGTEGGRGAARGASSSSSSSSPSDPKRSFSSTSSSLPAAPAASAASPVGSSCAGGAGGAGGVSSSSDSYSESDPKSSLCCCRFMV
mmetsp:Transcript_62070/g.164694  ORF Transcript_62070/g.164694 Transcript_62070/m.164694 type:complete len:236 (-) Transcript_62070:51-758(-)